MTTKAEKEAGLVMGTNNSSIVSKRSVERLYYPEPHFFRYFVKKPQRRSPLINRGYWLRMRAIEQSVRQFLDRPSKQPKLVLNFGCGFDPLPFQFLHQFPELCQNSKFLDIDHRKLMIEKCGMIQQCKELSDLIPGADFLPERGSVFARSEQYVAIGCDMADIQGLQVALSSEVDLTQSSILCVSEVALTYMTVEATDSLIRWTSSLSEDVQFCLLEQQFPDGPEHPFAETMMKHFNKLRTPLYSIHAYPSLRHQERRFIACGWQHAKARSLWELWNDSGFIDDAQAASLDGVEVFDEWEEFALFAAHYFLLSASSCPLDHEDVPSQHEPTADSNGTSDAISPHLNLLPKCPPKFNSQRRFSAAVAVTNGIVGLHGGSGRQTRLSSSDLYSSTIIEDPVFGLPPRTVAARMCHTITEFNDGKCLLVGGRSSPTSALGDCWLRHDMEWRMVESLSVPRFRHCSTRVKLSGEECVLVHGGRSQTGDVLGDFQMWRKSKGWQRVRAAGSTPTPRFGACISSICEETGVLCGGMDKRGRVLSGFWIWTLMDSEDGIPTIDLEDRSGQVSGNIPALRWLERFGASISATSQHLTIIGGISAYGVVPHEYEVLILPFDALRALYGGANECHRRCVAAPLSSPAGPRPLLVGHSSYTVAEGQKVLILGGGAVCFSFGTHWNEGTWLLQNETCDSGNEWVPVEAHTGPEQSISPATEKVNQADGAFVPLTTISRVKISSYQEFETIVSAARPVILEGLDVGPCSSSLWTEEYLKDAVGRDRKIVVHESRSDHMNFQAKNFSYVTKEFGQFIDEVAAGSRQYLRSISSEKPTEVPANFREDFPSLKDDFRLPDELSKVAENMHSSPLRVSGPVTLWLHYDVLANVLCQVRGEKNLILYPPWDVSQLAFPAGASSSSINVFQDTSSDAPPISPAGTNPHKASLKPGDILFIPPLWPHTACPTDGMSVAVNVFFRNLAANCYAPGRDVYGNRDLQAYEKGRRDIEKIARTFDRLPQDAARFYLSRLADELKEKATT